VYEQELAQKFKRIFGVEKVTYDLAGETQEQDTLFIEIEDSRNVVKDSKVHSYITGNAVIYGMSSKLPFAFFSKQIAEADLADTKDLYFFDFEKNTRRFRNIVARQVSFIYFFSGQYDPDDGTITSVQFIEES
jgi:hypothetical protein